MTWLDEIPEPTDAELSAIEADGDLERAEVALVDAEAALFARPNNATAAAYLQALLDVVDLHDFTDGSSDELQVDTRYDENRWPCLPAAAGALR